MKARVLVADDHTLLRAGLIKLIETIPGLEIAGEASDGQQVLDKVQSCAPDLVLLDIAMPKISGLEVCATLRARKHDIKVLMLSMHKEQQYVHKSLQNGASGYLLKDSAPDELATAMLTVLQGKTYLSAALAQGMVSDMVSKMHGKADTAEPDLTPRQREVLKLAAEGLSTKEIAIRLNLSVKTVDTHRTNLMNQLDIHDLAGLVRYAIRTGIASANL